MAGLFGEHEEFALERVRRGDVVLVLGAGANYGSENALGEPLKDGKALAAYLADLLGYEYTGETLTDVANAFIHKMGIEPFRKELRAEFLNTRPSRDLVRLFRFPWRRVYTWNIDDALVKASRNGIQQAFFKNGMCDKVDDHPNIDAVQVVYLHGRANCPEDGFIFSEKDYAAALQAGGHAWYAQAVDDYRSFCPIFVGSALNEPILAAELERAAILRGTESGLAFLITPDELSEIRKASLEARKIYHVRATTTQFVEFLRNALGDQWSPQDVIARVNRIAADSLARVSKDELAAAQFITPISHRTASKAFHNLTVGQRAILGRRFLTGFPADWRLAASDIPVRLTSYTGLRDSMREAVVRNAGLFVTLGPAGSGKSTATMQALLELSQDDDLECYELSPDADRYADVLSVLRKINHKPKVLFLPVLYLFGGALADYIEQARNANITLVSTARSSEWGSHLERLFGKVSVTYDFKRFSQSDYKPLISRLTYYVPAPRFVQLGERDQIRRLSESKNQLLVALREATESKTFDEIILDEFESIKSELARRALLAIGVATLARVGIRRDFLLDTLAPHSAPDAVMDALNALDGIIYESGSRRLFVRHDMYVRPVFASLGNFSTLRDTITGVLKAYLKYKMPIMRNVGKQDGALFRFLFNHDFVYEQAKTYGDASRGREVYSEFEVPFQLDGHFWLQYGLFVAEIGAMEEAIDKLQKSIQAYPGNQFAHHALASLQLRLAYYNDTYDRAAQDAVGEAVQTLREMDANPAHKSDHYPIVTLASRHTGVLIKHGRQKEAKIAAQDYLAKLQRLEKTNPAMQITNAKEALLRYLAVGIWTPPEWGEKIL